MVFMNVSAFFSIVSASFLLTVVVTLYSVVSLAAFVSARFLPSSFGRVPDSVSFFPNSVTTPSWVFGYESTVANAALAAWYMA